MALGALSSPTASGTTYSPAATHTVEVANGGFYYTPNTTFASPGDVIEFVFYPLNHSVVRAEYEFPCIPYEDTGLGKTGFFSGFQPVITVIPGKLPTWQLPINDTKPIFFYCSAPGSCINYGMVGVINPNASVSLQTQYELARNSTYMLQPGEAYPSEQTLTTAATASSTAEYPYSSSTGSLSTTTTTSAAVVVSTSPPSTATPKSGGLSGGAIAGIAIGATTAVILLGALAFVLRRSWTRRRAANNLTRFTPAGTMVKDMVEPTSPYIPEQYGNAPVWEPRREFHRAISPPLQDLQELEAKPRKGANSNF